MSITHIVRAGVAAAVCLGTLAACGGRAKETAVPQHEMEMQNTRLGDALDVDDVKHASAMADSMALFVDDLTPEQTVQVLTAFVSVHNDAVANRQGRRDLETLRKFVDVYDIALSVNGAAVREAFAKAKRINPAADFDSLAAAFRERLGQYDAVQDGSLTAAPETADTLATDTVAEEIPIDLRPAQ